MLTTLTCGIMAILGIILLAKKAEEQNEESFWVQMSLTGGKALEWLNTKNGEMELIIERLAYGKVKYFYQHFDFAKALEVRDKLELESNVFLAFCSNIDRVVLIDQNGAKKALQKLMLIERENGNVKGDAHLSKTYLDKTGFTNVFEVEFKKQVGATFELKKDGQYSHYHIRDSDV